MKKFLAVLCAAMLTLVGVAAFAGCDNEITIPDEQGYTIKIGYTEYAPMNYRDENGDFVGYDTEFAIQLCKDLGYNYEFVLLNDWATKVVDLNAGTIDLVWNGMTITDDLKKNILISEPYMTNQQVIVGTAETLAKYDSVESLANATSIAYETGSAAETLVTAIEGIENVSTVPAQSQAKALMEVGAGTAELAVIDLTMARSMTGEGTNYADITYKNVGFAEEQYGIGARKTDTAFMEKLNAKIAEYQKNGFLDSLYQKYFAAE